MRISQILSLAISHCQAHWPSQGNMNKKLKDKGQPLDISKPHPPGWPKGPDPNCNVCYILASFSTCHAYLYALINMYVTILANKCYTCTAVD